jgi:hypothetical protein
LISSDGGNAHPGRLSDAAEVVFGGLPGALRVLVGGLSLAPTATPSPYIPLSLSLLIYLIDFSPSPFIVPLVLSLNCQPLEVSVSVAASHLIRVLAISHSNKCVYLLSLLSAQSDVYGFYWRRCEDCGPSSLSSIANSLFRSAAFCVFDCWNAHSLNRSG